VRYIELCASALQGVEDFSFAPTLYSQPLYRNDNFYLRLFKPSLPGRVRMGLAAQKNPGHFLRAGINLTIKPPYAPYSVGSTDQIIF